MRSPPISNPGGPCSFLFGEFENAGIFQEEGPLLRKKQLETRQIDLASIGFRFRKIRVDRRAGNQIGCNTIRNVRSGIRASTFTDILPRNIPGEPGNAIRFDVKADALRRIFDSGDVARL